ncbi:MAG: hypothetical protein ACK6AT_02670 [Planctomycetota bacterium]
MQTKPLRSSYTKRLMLSGLMLCLFAGCKPEADVQRDIAAQEAAQKAAAAAAAEESLVAQKAGVGVGVKGRSLEGSSESNPATLISAPAAAYFRTKEKIAFEIQIPQALYLYMAEKGRNPRNHDEFMRDIIDANRIVLPKLPTGMVYRYDSEKGELWVIPEKDLQSQSGQQPNP